MAQGDVTCNISKPSGKAIYFDGSAKIDCGAGSTIYLTTQMSVALWFKQDAGAGNDMKLINKGGAGDEEFDVAFWAGKPQTVLYYTAGNKIVEYAVNLRDGLWHSYIITAEGGKELKMYIDGILRDTETITSPYLPRKTTANLWLGCRVGGWQFFEGKMEDVRMWNRIVSQAEATAFHAKKQVSPVGLVAHYPFENAADPYRDETGNGNDGTETNTIVQGGIGTTEDDVKAARVTASDIYNFIPMANGRQIMTVHIEEA